MKFPVCDVCLKSDILCNACKEKISNGEFKESHLRLFKAMERIMPKALDARVKRVLEAYDLLVVVTGREDVPKMVGNGISLRKLSREIEKPVRVVAEARDYREFLENVLFPAGIAAVNVVYTPEKEILKVMVQGKMPVPAESLNDIMKREYGKEIRIVKG